MFLTSPIVLQTSFQPTESTFTYEKLALFEVSGTNRIILWVQFFSKHASALMNVITMNWDFVLTLPWIALERLHLPGLQGHISVDIRIFPARLL